MNVWSSRIITLLRNHGWVLNLLFIALGAYFVAGAVNAVVARSVRVVPSLEQGTSRPSITPHLQMKSDYTNIAERNLMAIKRENLNPVSEAAAEEAGIGDTYTEGQLRPCTLAGGLKATLVAEGAPEWSIAVVIVGQDPVVFSANEGRNKISDDATLVEIRERAVVVRRRDHYELCKADEDKPTLASVAPPPMSGGEAPVDSGGGAGVTKVSETAYTIDRSEINKAFDNLSEVATQARIVPSFKNGKSNGFKLFSIKPGSIYQKIGLQNGDVIQKINGYEMSTPDKALEIYGKLKEASSVSVELQRRGQSMTMGYTIP